MLMQVGPEGSLEFGVEEGPVRAPYVVQLYKATTHLA